MKIYKPNDEQFIYNPNDIHVFLGGSIEMGKAENWQNKIAQYFSNDNLTFINPRRDSWNDSWIQEEKNLQFNYQVNWELTNLELADIIFMYLSPETISPISLLEIGLYANSKKIIICCPNGFHRKGNIQILSTRYQIPLFHTFDDAIGGLTTMIMTLNAKKNLLIK